MAYLENWFGLLPPVLTLRPYSPGKKVQINRWIERLSLQISHVSNAIGIHGHSPARLCCYRPSVSAAAEWAY